MARKAKDQPPKAPTGKPSPLVDTRVIYCGDNLDHLAKLPDRSVALDAFNLSSDALHEIGALFRRSHKVTTSLTVKSVLKGDFAQKPLETFLEVGCVSEPTLYFK